MRDLRFKCARCGSFTDAVTAGARCRHCAGLFDNAVYHDAAITTEVPLVRELGIFPSPLLSRALAGPVYLKNEAVLPTGSYKDRGARSLVGACRAMGVDAIVEDSSGNAGAAIAAYAAAAGIRAEIFVKTDAAPGKVRQIAAYGAAVRRVSGSREDLARAAQARARDGAYYASHVYNPLFMLGVESAATEIIDEIGVPEELYVPAGNGALLLALAAGFRRHGDLPRLIAVQSELLAPLYEQVYGRPPRAAEPGAAAADSRTIADGISVAAPARLGEMAAVIRESGGTVVTVSDTAIREAQRLLGYTGLYAEPTGAVATAGFRALNGGSAWQRGGPRVIFLTGSGLKECANPGGESESFGEAT